tara:strand:- start:496 stop:822 length:327 start_codon:yes stop_codon:yes gene_type:complete
MDTWIREMKKTEYKTKAKTPLGVYILDFINRNQLTYKKFCDESGVSITTLKNLIYIECYSLQLQNFFKVADYMHKKNSMPIEFYLRRLKEHIEEGKKIEARKKRLKNG